MSSSPTPRRRGLFFSFEGIDGSGKSTQAQRLAAALTERGERVVSVREPGGTPLGEEVRALLLNPAAHISDRAEALLFAAARAQLVQEVIEPALQSGTHVIADRYVDSTSAYKGGGRGLGNAVDAISRFATGGFLPDRTYLVVLPVAEAAQRRSDRTPDRIEQAPHAFRDAIAATYYLLSARHPDRILPLDGRLSVDALQRLILSDAMGLMRAAT